MALNKSTLTDALARVLETSPATAADAAAQWANAYAAYAAAATSSAFSLPVNATANVAILLGGFQSGLAALMPVSAGALVAQGVMTFWQAIAWMGPTATGTTAFPGNAGLAAMLSGIFTDLGRKSPRDKANELADAFDAGARAVVVVDVPFVQPAPPIVGPIQ
jgi:AcrR family transcriptional regulator